MEIARYRALGYAQLTSMTAATSFATASVTVPAGTTHALLRTGTQNVRWRDDGVAPTASVGFLMTTADPPLLYSGPMSALQFITTTAGAVLDVSFYGLAG